MGLVGCGKVAHLHARALGHLPNAEFVGVHSRSSERAEAFARNYGAKAYRSASDLIVRGGAEVVLVCTPHPEHAAPTIAALLAGAHVLVEKPLASSLEDCDAMITQAKAKKRTLGMISQRRLFPPVRRLQKAVMEGKIGDPVLAVATLLGWRDQHYYESDSWRGSWSGEGGGVFLNQGSHLVDLVQWIMGPVAEVTGSVSNVNHPYIEVEDTVVATLRFATGGLGSLVWSNAQNPALYGKIMVCGRTGAAIGIQTEGGAMFLPGRTEVAEPPKIDFWNVPGEEHEVDEWNAVDRKEFASTDPTVYYHQLQIADFLRAVEHGTEPMVTGEEGRKSVEIIQAVYRTHRERTQQAAEP